MEPQRFSYMKDFYTFISQIFLMFGQIYQAENISRDYNNQLEQWVMGSSQSGRDRASLHSFSWLQLSSPETEMYHYQLMVARHYRSTYAALSWYNRYSSLPTVISGITVTTRQSYVLQDILLVNDTEYHFIKVNIYLVWWLSLFLTVTPPPSPFT